MIKECGGITNNEAVKRSCTDLPCLLLLIVCCVGWAGVAGYAFSKGNPTRLFHPINSAGETCGQGNQTGKPNLLYFSLTRCAGLSAAVGGCPTPQVCVEECPITYWTSAQGKSSGLEQFCDNVTSSKMKDTTTYISKLVVERSCPAYVLPSTSVMGRCLPRFGLVRREEDGRAEAKMKAIKTEDGKVLDVDRLLGGVEYVMESIDNRGYGDKLLAYLPLCWWILLMTLVLCLVLSLTSIVLIKMGTKPVLWTSIVLCLSILVAGTVFSLIKYTQLRAVRDDVFLPPVITSMSSYLHNKNTWLIYGVILGSITLITFMFLVLLLRKSNLAILLIEEASKYLGSTKSVFLIPIVQSVIQVLLISMFVTVGSFLATSGSPEYRVVDACSSETCINMDTEKMFALNDICDPATFAECTGCPRAQCVYHKFGPSVLGYWLQVYNFLVMLWLLVFVQSWGNMVMGGAFAGCYWDQSSTEMWFNFMRTCRYHLGTVACGSLVPAVCCMKSGVRCLNMSGFVITAVHGENFRNGRKMYVSLLARNCDILLGLDIVTTFILFTVKLFIICLAAAATFATFSAQVGSSLEIHLNYQFVPIMIVIMGSYAIISNFVSIYSMAVETMLLGFLEGVEKPDGRKDNCYFKSSDLKQILEQKDQLEMRNEPCDYNDNINQISDVKMSNPKHKHRG